MSNDQRPRVDRYTCEETIRRLDEYLDRELTPAETEMVRAHLETCEVCAREYAFEAAVLDEVRRKLRRIDAPADLAAKVSALLSTERREQADGGGM